MKIYSKKRFISGALIVALGLLNLILSVIRKDLDGNAILLISALFVLGLCTIRRSLSRKIAKEDQLEELDERNRLITLKSNSMSFRLTQLLSFILMLGCLVMGKVSGDTGFIAMGVGIAFTFPISMLTELCTYLCYESKN